MVSMLEASLFIRSSSVERRRARKREAQRKYRRRIRQDPQSQNNGERDERDASIDRDVIEEAEGIIKRLSNDPDARDERSIYEKDCCDSVIRDEGESDPTLSSLFPNSPVPSVPSPTGTLSHTLINDTSAYSQGSFATDPTFPVLYPSPYQSPAAFVHPWDYIPNTSGALSYHKEEPSTSSTLPFSSFSSYQSTPAVSEHSGYSLASNHAMKNPHEEWGPSPWDSLSIPTSVFGGASSRVSMVPYSEGLTMHDKSHLEVQPLPSHFDHDIKRGRTKVRKTDTPLLPALGDWPLLADASDPRNVAKSSESKTGRRGLTPLFQAVMLGQLQIVKILVERCSDLNVTDMMGQTILHVAAERGYVDIVKFLLGCDANLDIRDNEGNTALHLAVVNGYERIVSILVEAGADMEIVNHPPR